MKIPTIADLLDERIKSFRESFGGFNPNSLKEDKEIKTGTTIVAICTKDLKSGVIACDGRLTLGFAGITEADDALKIYQFPFGFLGFAGSFFACKLGLQEFKERIDLILRERRNKLSATAARNILDNIYTSLILNNIEDVAFILLAWDFFDSKVRMYKFAHGFISENNYCSAVGSGYFVSLGDEVLHCQQNPPETLEEAKNLAIELILKPRIRDQHTGGKIFVASMTNGNEFSIDTIDSENPKKSNHKKKKEVEG